jgi:hypothetical protein
MCKAGFTRQPAPTSLTLPDRLNSTTAEETAIALLHKFFDDHTAHDSAQQKSIRAQVAVSKLPASQAVPNFKNHEVEEIIRKLQDRKCPRPDGINGAIVKRMHKMLPTFWTTLFNKCFLLGCFPKAWKQANVIAIPTTDKSKLHNVQGYRSISLLSIPSKCLEKLLIGRFNHFLEPTGQIPPQYVFTAGRSSADAITTVVRFAQRARKRETKCCLLELDIASAFVNAWHPGILARLWEQKCPLNIYSIIKDFLQDRNAHIQLGEAASSKRVTRGCLQG